MKLFTKIKGTLKRGIRKLNVSQIIIGTFFVIILVGALLLTLPVSARDGKSLGFFNALFTATSATCVTGLSLGDTYTQWSTFGQVVLLTLIEIGGLGFMSIASLFFFSLKRKIDLKPMLVMAQAMGTDNMNDVIRVQKKLIVGSFLFEILGAIVLCIRFLKWYSFPKALWLGVFHSVSAFCNAGFDIFGFEAPGTSLMIFQSDPVVLITLSIIIIVGGIGFIVWDDITSRRRPSRWSIYTKVVLLFTAVLLMAGTVGFLVFESNNKGTIGEFSFGLKLTNAFFQSATTRTAGFAAIDQGSLTETGKIFTIILMFIGGASGSTAGGLKVVTFAVIILFLLSRMRGKDQIVIFSRKLSESQIMNALCLFGMMTILSIIGAMAICGTTDIRFVDGLYESVSALATVGLSTGALSVAGTGFRILIMLYMFFGRIGILTISMGFLQKTNNGENIKYPEINMLIG